MGKKAVLPGFFKAFNLSQARKGVNPQGSDGLFRALEREYSGEFRDYSEEKQMPWDLTT